MIHKAKTRVKLPERDFMEDHVQSLAAIHGEGYRAAKAQEIQDFSSSEEDPAPIQFLPPNHTKNALSVGEKPRQPVIFPASRHRRSSSEYPRPSVELATVPVTVPTKSVPSTSAKTDEKKEDDSDEMSESERIIREIIKERNATVGTERPFFSAQEDSLNQDPSVQLEARYEQTEPVAIGFEQRISSILGNIAGERKNEEMKRWQLKQHLLELLDTKKELNQYDEVFYDSDVKKSKEEMGTQKFTEGFIRSSEVSNATITGPGSSFLINETYEREKPIPEFHECAKPGLFPRRNRSISTHVKEGQTTSDQSSPLYEASVGSGKNLSRMEEDQSSEAVSLLKAALEILLRGSKKVKEAVFRILDSKKTSSFVVILHLHEEVQEFLGLYERFPQSLSRLFSPQELPPVLKSGHISGYYRLDPVSLSFKRIPGVKTDQNAEGVTLISGVRPVF